MWKARSVAPFVVVAGVSFVRAQEADVAHHLAKLEGDARHLARIVEKPPGTPERAALERYVQTPAGAQRLARLWVGDLLDTVTLGREPLVVFGFEPEARARGRGGDGESAGSIWVSGGRGSGGYRTRDGRILAAHERLRELDVFALGEVKLGGVYKERVFRLVPGGVGASLTRGGLRADDAREMKGLAVIARGAVLGPAMWFDPAERLGGGGLRALLLALSSDDPRESEMASVLLEFLGIDVGDPASFVLEVLAARPDEIELADLLPLLAKHAGKVVPRLVEGLKSPVEDRRLASAVALGTLGDAARGAIPELAGATKDESPRVRAAAVTALWRIGEEAVPALVDLLADPNDDIHGGAMRALAMLGPRAAAAASELERIARDTRRPVGMRRAAASALAAIDPSSRITVATPRPASTRPPARPPSRRAPPRTRMRDTEAFVARKAEIERIARERDVDALPDLIRATSRESDVELTQTAGATIRSFGREALPALEQAVLSADPGEATVAAVNVTALGRDAVPMLVKALGNPQVRTIAAIQLGQLGAAARAAVAPLRDAVESSGSRVEAIALYEIDPRFAGESVGRLLEEFVGTDRARQDSIVSELVSVIGKDALPHLEEALEDSDGEIRRAAGKAIAELTKPAPAPPARTAPPSPRGRPSARRAGEVRAAREARASPPFRESRATRSAPDASREVDVARLLAALRGDDDAVAACVALVALDRAGRGDLASSDELVTLCERAFASDELRFRSFGAGSWLETAARLLVRRGDAAERAVTLFAGQLAAEDKETIAAALGALEILGPLAAGAVPPITEQLDRRNRRLRIAAMDALGGIGVAAAGAVPALVESLAFGDALHGFRDLFASAALARIGAASVPALRRALRHESDVVRQGAAEALMRIGPRAAEAIPELSSLLGDPSFLVRTQAAISLDEVGVGGDEALLVLFAGLEDESVERRTFAAHGLGQLGACAAAAVPYIERRLEEAFLADPEEQSFGRELVDALGAMRSAAAVRVLGRILADDAFKELRRDVCSVLRRCGEVPDEIVAALGRLARSDDDEVAAAAIRALGEQGERAHAAVPFLVEVLCEAPPPEDFVGRRSRRELDRSPPAAVYRMRLEAAIEALANIGSAARAALPALEALLDAEDVRVRLDAANAYARIGGAPEIVLPIAREALLDDAADTSSGHRRYSSSRLRAIRVLGHVGPAARAAAPDLVACLGEEDSLYAFAAAVALWRIGARRDDAVAFLERASASGDPRVRSGACRAYADLARDAPAFLSRVERALDDPDHGVRRSARYLLDAFRASARAGER